MVKKNSIHQKKIRVYTAGTWDLFHIGHLNILKKSKLLGDELIVGVSTDKLVASYKNNYPAVSFKYRKAIVKDCKYVDEVVKQEKLLNPKQIKKLKIDILTIGDDWKNKYMEGLEWAKKQKNIKVVYLPYTKNISSTKIKQNVINGVNKSTLSLKDKKVLVTGGNSGIGASIAEKFAKCGAQVGIHYFKNHSDALKIAKELSRYTTIKLYQQDFSKSNPDVVKKFIADFGTIDILINNAGMMDEKSFFEISPDDYDKIFKVNSKAPFFLSKDAFKEMERKKFGRIISIGSNVVKFGTGRNGSIQYAATKSTLEVLTKGLAKFGAKYNIIVNCIRPGVVNTKMQEKREDYLNRISLIPLKRMGTVEDISNLVIYLCSDAGSYITGQIINVTGGE